MNTDNTQQAEQARKSLVRKLLMFSGALFMIMGAAVFLYAPDISASTEADNTTIQIVGGMLGLVGISDFLIAKIMFKDKS